MQAWDRGDSGHSLRRRRHDQGSDRGRGLDGPRKTCRSRCLLGLVEKASNQPLVLVVDDDLELCENLWQILRDVGFRVAIAHDLKSATDQILESSFRVVLIDMKLNAGDGSQVFRVIRESNSHARSILVTAHRPEMESLVDQVLAEGADAACYKPFDVKQLLDTLEHLAKFEE